MWTLASVLLVGLVLFALGALYALAFGAGARRGWLAVDGEPSLIRIGTTWLVSGTLFAVVLVWRIDVVQRWLGYSPAQSAAVLDHAPFLGLCSVGMATRTMALRLWPRSAEVTGARLQLVHPSTLAAAGASFTFGAVLALLLVIAIDWPRLIFG